MLYKPQTKAPNATDAHVGSRIRLRRMLMGLSQTTLAEGLGVSFQQVQKYEKGENRVGSSRLQAISSILGVPVAWFFEDGPGAFPEPWNAETGGGQELTLFLNSVEGVSLNRAFVKIHDGKIRRRIVDLVTALAKEASE